MGEPAASRVELGLVDYLLVEFPRGHSTFGAALTAELAHLADEGLIRLLDLVIIQKAADGSVRTFEVDQLATDELHGLEDDVSAVLSAGDVERLAAAVEPGNVAGAVVWENLWSTGLGSAATDSGAQVIGSARIPLERLACALSERAVVPWRAHQGTISAPVARLASWAESSATASNNVAHGQPHRT